MNETERVDRVRDIFDDWAERGRAEGMEKGHSPTALQAFEKLGLKAGQHYLDIGCGNGYTVRWAASVDPSVQACGLDVSGNMVERARALSGNHPNARFIHAPFPLPMLKAQAFDAVFSMEVFYYLPDLSWGLSNVARLLKPGGLFACVVDYYLENEASHSWPEDLGVPMKLLSEAGWREAMEEIGFEIVEQSRLRATKAAENDAIPGSLMTLVRRP